MWFINEFLYRNTTRLIFFSSFYNKKKLLGNLILSFFKTINQMIFSLLFVFIIAPLLSFVRFCCKINANPILEAFSKKAAKSSQLDLEYLFICILKFGVENSDLETEKKTIASNFVVYFSIIEDTEIIINLDGTIFFSFYC